MPIGTAYLPWGWNYHTPANDPQTTEQPPPHTTQATQSKDSPMKDFFNTRNLVAAGAATVAVFLAIALTSGHHKVVQGLAGVAAAGVALPLAAKAAA